MNAKFISEINLMNANSLVKLNELNFDRKLLWPLEAWQAGNDITVRFFRSLLYRLSIDNFCLSLSIKKLFNIFHLGGESPLRVKFGNFLAILNHLTKFAETSIPKGDNLTPNRVV
jgi:hypothetical protein